VSFTDTKDATMPALYLTEDDVREILDMELALATLEEAFQALAENRIANVPRQRAHGVGIMLHTMSAAADYLGVVGWKNYTTTASGHRQFLVGVHSQADGQLLGLLQADFLGQMRTGAASGVATEAMARPEAEVVGVFGSGLQARTQLKAVCTVRNIKQVEIYSRNEERRTRFAEEMSEWCNTKVVAVHTPDEAAREKDIVICATSARTPLFDGRVLDEGTHLNVAGSNFLEKSEIDVATLQRADIIVCDNKAQCRLEAGDFVPALEQGAIDWANIKELKDVVVGQTPGRSGNDQITLFKSVGLALEDVAVAAKVLEVARQQGLGVPLPF